MDARRACLSDEIIVLPRVRTKYVALDQTNRWRRTVCVSDEITRGVSEEDGRKLGISTTRRAVGGWLKRSSRRIPNPNSRGHPKVEPASTRRKQEERRNQKKQNGPQVSVGIRGVGDRRFLLSPVRSFYSLLLARQLCMLAR